MVKPLSWVRLPQYERSGVSVASPEEIPEGGDGGMGSFQLPMPHAQFPI